MEPSDDLISKLETLQNKVEDLETRVGEVLTKQLHMKQELGRMLEVSTTPVEPIGESTPELQLPDDYHFTEQLKNIMDNMVARQKSQLQIVENTKALKTGLHDSKIFKEITTHITDRLEYLEMVITLLKEPLFTEPDPPPPPPIPEEEKLTKESKVEGKDKGKAGPTTKKKKK